MQIFPESITSLWNKWELRVLVLLSLLWQVVLIMLGSWRKYRRGALISCLVWVTYLSADWLATVSLGNLANNSGDEDMSKSKPKIESKDQMIKALWAPFLLLHLGGPDTITAYALEDNSLWLRHLLGLLVQVSVAFYVFLRSWGNNALTFVAIPVFVSGIIKYSERTWALRLASPEQFEDSLVSALTLHVPADLKHIQEDPKLDCVHKGYSMFPLLKRLYADLSLTFAEGQQSFSLMVKEGTTEIERANYAFQLVEVQLGFLFDVLYTKATVIYTTTGLILRLISFISIVSALVAYVVVIDDTYSRVDVVITYILFAGAVSLEIYAFFSLISSDWTRRCSTEKRRLPKCVSSTLSCFRTILCLEKRWSGSMAQQNLVDFCVKETGPFGTKFYSKIRFEWNLLQKRRWEEVDDALKALIFKELNKKYEEYKKSGFDGKTLRGLLYQRGKRVIVESGLDDVIGWSCQVEFDHSILLWHVATDICYHSDLGDAAIGECKASKRLSDYFLYILLMRPLMLPKWIDRITHVRDTFNQAIRLFHRRKFRVKTKTDACKVLIQLHTQCEVLEVLRKEKSGKSVLLDACSLAVHLQNYHPKEELWKMIFEVWMEMLIYAAGQGDWGSHAHQLRNGGELLTHVGLLMADLGLSEHFGTGAKGPPLDSQNKGWGWARTKLPSPDGC